MANQQQPHPWLRLATLARTAQPPAPTPAPQTQQQAPAPPLARPPLIRPPTFRPAATQTVQPPPPPSALSPTPPPRTSAPPPSSPAPPPPSVAPRAVAPPPPPVAPRAIAPPPPSVAPRAVAPPPPSVAPRAVAPPPRSPSSPVVTNRPTPTSRISPSPSPKSSPVSKVLKETSPPKPQIQSSPAPSIPSSPVPRSQAIVSPLKPSTASPVTAQIPSANGSVREVKPLPETPPRSPNTKPAISPPSPFALPPSQLKSDDKTVVVQETVGKPKSLQQPHVKQRKERDGYWKSSDSEDASMRVITIAGENKGAIMELGSAPRRNNPYSSTVKTKQSENDLRDSAGVKPPSPMHVNSNVQGINSSILFNSSCSHHDPGVHLSLSRKPLNGHGHGSQLNGHANGKGNFRKDNEKWYSN